MDHQQINQVRSYVIFFSILFFFKSYFDMLFLLLFLMLFLVSLFPFSFHQFKLTCSFLLVQ